ncbi:MAG: M3 family oligoendopeptidase [Clostridioides sp.]|jgi:M3 family oligoendopeptidase|nr:M3 family oligoendopeptidase [Clostridioides sp.]
MKFSEFKYERPDYEELRPRFMYCVEKISKSETYKEQKKYIENINEIRNVLKSMNEIIQIRYSMNTDEVYYREEKSYWDEEGPLYDELNSYFYKSIVESKFKNEIIEDYGSQFYKICEFSLKAFSKDIIAELQEENRLCSEYTRLLASAKIEFRGEVRNLSGIYSYMLSGDRKTREEASEKYYGFFEEKSNDFDCVFDRLVKLRDEIGKKLGYENFIEVGYLRMMRTEYDRKMVEIFRNQVEKDIIPLAEVLYERQARRLGVESLDFIDENIEFKSGNPTPKGDASYILESGVKMYTELSDETGEFIKFILENELIDWKERDGKAAGGYCTYIPAYKSPFIFSNFNSTLEDIDVLTHEAGHAFQLYMSRWISSPEINFPTLDSCEIHSMSMEFITWPWMELFFGDEADKYRFSHLSTAIKFIPYGVLVDEFQHIIYENPGLSPKERNEVWRNLERKYQPHREYPNCEFLESGGWWYKQGHIFKNPFYYIDYALAQVCSLQIWEKSRVDESGYWEDFKNMCKVGGSKSFTEIVSIGRLKSPFAKGSLFDVAKSAKKYFDSIDDIEIDK